VAGIPRVDEERILVKPLRKAVLPVAGLGTRFLPATKAMPKEMLPVVDKPLIQYAVDEARAAGIEQFCMVTGRGKAKEVNTSLTQSLPAWVEILHRSKIIVTL